MEIVLNVIKHVLMALYQYFSSALLASVFFMFFYMHAKKHGIKETCKTWIDKFKKDKEFRKTFFFAFYTMMILLRTIFCRNMWMNPVSNIMGIWSFHDADGNLNTEMIENLILFIPFTALFFDAFKERLFGTGMVPAGKMFKKSFCVSACLSFGIEFIQLFLRVGTFQLSDLFFNILGGIIGGLIFMICSDLSKKK